MENWEIVKDYCLGKKVLRIKKEYGKDGFWEILENPWFNFDLYSYRVSEPKKLTCLDFAGWYFKATSGEAACACSEFLLDGSEMNGSLSEVFKEGGVEFSKDLKTWVTWQEREDELNKELK